jgi:chromate reductase
MITIIVGTNRSGSVSAQVAAFVAKVYDELGINNRVLDIADLPPETFSPNAYVEKPPRVVEFTEQILASSGLFVITPEYNGSMSGALKLFIDMLPFPESFEDRPVSYIGISAGQTHPDLVVPRPARPHA